MNFGLNRIPVPLWLIYAGAIVVVIAGLGYWYERIEPTNSKGLTLIGGIFTGLVVYLATFLTILRPFRELDRFRRMGIKALLPNRHDQAYYRELVVTSRLRVNVMGASCSRFVRDFLDLNSDDKVLIDALTRNSHLKVRLLIPTDTFMSEDERGSTSRTLAQIAAVRERFGGRVQLRRFNDKARHSFVIVDNDLVAGPIFENDMSRHAPAVHVATETVFGEKYYAHFEAVWNSVDASQ